MDFECTTFTCNFDILLPTGSCATLAICRYSLVKYEALLNAATQKEGFPPLYSFGKEEWVRHFPFSIFITVETHAYRVVQKCLKYERTLNVMSKKATSGNLS